MNHTKESLQNFEQWTEETFNAGKLKSPVHLSGSKNGEAENALIEIFKEIKPQDWVFTTYRSHYHALLKGVPEQRLKDWILDNKSIHFMDSEYKVFSSAIVGGCLPIAIGTAMAIKRKKEEWNNWDTKVKGKPEKGRFDSIFSNVYCFIGDMTASLGVFNDCLTYAFNHKLPITFVVENNHRSTDTFTHEVWGITESDLDKHFENLEKLYPNFIIQYRYERKFPHYGTGVFLSSLWKDIIAENDARNKGF